MCIFATLRVETVIMIGRYWYVPLFCMSIGRRGFGLGRGDLRGKWSRNVTAPVW